MCTSVLRSYVLKFCLNIFLEPKILILFLEEYIESDHFFTGILMMLWMFYKGYLLVVITKVYLICTIKSLESMRQISTCTSYLFIVLNHQNNFISIKNHILFLEARINKGDKMVNLR